jgi:hypothetical protein
MMFFTVEIRTVNATFYVVKFVSYERGWLVIVHTYV